MAGLPVLLPSPLGPSGLPLPSPHGPAANCLVDPIDGRASSAWAAAAASRDDARRSIAGEMVNSFFQKNVSTCPSQRDYDAAANVGKSACVVYGIWETRAVRRCIELLLSPPVQTEEIPPHGHDARSPSQGSSSSSAPASVRVAWDFFSSSLLPQTEQYSPVASDCLAGSNPCHAVVDSVKNQFFVPTIETCVRPKR